jgi:hypothetical protein
VQAHMRGQLCLKGRAWTSDQSDTNQRADGRLDGIGERRIPAGGACG